MRINYSFGTMGTMLLVIPALLFVNSCSDVSQIDPKNTVISFFGAMEQNDEAALAHILDLAELMKNVDQDYSLNSDEPRILTSPKQILEDLTNDGLTKKRWFAHQRIINKVEVMGETATVEVTFVDKAKSKGYRTRFGLHKMNGKWKIYSFKVLDSPPENKSEQEE